VEEAASAKGKRLGTVHGDEARGPEHPLGIDVPQQVVQLIRSNVEGRVEKVKYSELEAKLAMPEHWVPSGRTHVLTWLALGAPFP
jgi:hypothetical protein